MTLLLTEACKEYVVIAQEETISGSVARLPLSARELRNLEVFRLDLSETIIRSGLSLEYLLQLPIHLTELTIICHTWFQALSWNDMESAAGRPSLRFCGAHFPALQVLRLHGSHYVPNSVHMEFDWPPTLKMLELPDLEAQPHHLGIARLPSSITHLALGASTFEKSPMWLLRLASLQTLKLANLKKMHSSWISNHFPSSITHLDLRGLEKVEVEGSFSQAIPRSVLHLDLREASVAVFVDHLPPTLVSLRAKVENLRVFGHSDPGAIWGQLPQGLEVLELGSNIYQTSLDSPSSQSPLHPIDASHLAQLPSKLRSLSLRATWYPEMIDVLPRSLTELRIAGDLETIGPLPLLLANPPASLTSLTIDHEFDCLEDFMTHSEFVNQHLFKLLPRLLVANLFQKLTFRTTHRGYVYFDNIEQALREDRVEAVQELWTNFPKSHLRPSKVSQYIREGYSNRCFEWMAVNWNIIFVPELHARGIAKKEEYHHWIAKHDGDTEMIAYVARAFHLDIFSKNQSGRTMAEEAEIAGDLHLLNWLRTSTGQALTASQQSFLDQAIKNLESSSNSSKNVQTSPRCQFHCKSLTRFPPHSAPFTLASHAPFKQIPPVTTGTRHIRPTVGQQCLSLEGNTKHF